MPLILKFISLTLSKKDKLSFAFMTFLSLISASLEILTASIFVLLIDIIQNPDHSFRYLEYLGLQSDLDPSKSTQVILIGFGIFYLAKNIYLIFELYYQNFTAQRMNFEFKNELLKRYSSLDYSFYLTRNSSYGVSVVNNDVDGVFSNGVRSTCALFTELVVIGCLVSFSIFLNPSLFFFIAFLGGGMAYTLKKWIFPIFQNLGSKFQRSVFLSQQYLLQFFHAFKDIVLLNKQSAFLESFENQSKNLANVNAVRNTVNNMPRFITETLLIGIFVFAVCFLRATYPNPQELMAVMGGYLYVCFRVLPSANRMIFHLNNVKYSTSQVKRVMKEMNLEACDEAYVDEPNLSFKNSINLDDVSFRYLSSTNDSLKDVNLSIKKGEIIGIIGQTGSGKSTLVDVILGLLKPYKGSVLIDGQFPAHARQWHAHIGYVPQAIYLVDDTIEANIALGEKPHEVDSKRIKKAIEGAQLTHLIDKLDEGIKTVVGERGLRLSGGERQRIAIARALYRNPDVLIFDEATSALDNETEARLMETINAVSKDRTVIMIAHRLTTLKNCDRIIHMEEGRIVRESNYDSIDLTPDGDQITFC